jgi:hypothetical protein
LKKKNACITNSVGGKHNCSCKGMASKCVFGEKRSGSKICRFVMFVNNTTCGGTPVCKNKDARGNEREER